MKKLLVFAISIILVIPFSSIVYSSENKIEVPVKIFLQNEIIEIRKKFWIDATYEGG